MSSQPRVGIVRVGVFHEIEVAMDETDFSHSFFLCFFQ